ncbi:cystathionine gamma-synthase [Ranunculus cassubicifolius]
MAVAGFSRVLPSFECRSDPDFSTNSPKSNPKSIPMFGSYGCNGSLSSSSSPIFRFPPNFVRQLSIKARRNCSNIGVAQVVAASWSNNNNNNNSVPNVSAVDSVSAEIAIDDAEKVDNGGDSCKTNGVVQLYGSAALKASFLCSDASIAVHAGERLGRGIDTDGITTPVVNTTAYWFKNSVELIDFINADYGKGQSRQYSKVVVFSKAPLPNYRSDLDDKRPQREVIFSSYKSRRLIWHVGCVWKHVYADYLHRISMPEINL